MATIEKRITSEGETYRVKIRIKGRPTETASFERLTDARKWATITEGAIKDGKYFRNTEAKKKTFGDMIDRYIAHVVPNKPRENDKYSPQLRWWKEQLGRYTLADITPAMIAEQRDILLATPVTRRKRNRFGEIDLIDTKRSPSTVVRYMAALSHCFNIAVKEWGWLDDSPMRKVSKPKEARGRVRFLTDEERESLLAACKGSSNIYLYPVVVLALATGMRQGEVINLTWDDVDLKRERITLHETKNGERRVAPLVGFAKSVIVELSKVRSLNTNLLFPATKPTRTKSEASTYLPMFVRKAWYVALEEAGIEDFRFHDLRHSTASYLAMNGASLAEIAEVLGHKTLAMVKRYAHLSEAHTSKVVAAMNKKIFG